MILRMFGRYGGFGDGELIIIIFLAIIIALAIYVPFLLTLHRALAGCSPEVRRMNPGQVWLMFIPLFSLFWAFQVVSAIGDSFDGEYRRRGIPMTEPRPTYRLGMAWATIGVIGFVLSFIPILNVLSSLLSLANFVVWIVYWVKVAQIKNELKNQMVIPPYDPNYYMQNQQGAAQQYYNQQQYGQQQQNYNQQQQYGQQQYPPQQPNNTNPWTPPQNPNNGNPPPPPPAQ
jgi:hypothetical protein